MNDEITPAEYRALQDLVQEMEAELSAKEIANADLRRELAAERKAGDAYWGELLRGAP